MRFKPHLRRLDHVWVSRPVYFVTTCTADRTLALANPVAHEILREEWRIMAERSHWQVGRYVIMPDHVHFFAAASTVESPTLSFAIGRWKAWTARRILAVASARPPLWQKGFFDHVLRSSESRSEKWTYIRENPVRAGIVPVAELWPYSGCMDFE